MQGKTLCAVRRLNAVRRPVADIVSWVLAGMEDADVLDAREVLVVDHGELGVDVDWQASAAKLALWVDF